MRRRVVITGLGLITPLGQGKDALWEGLTLPRRVIAPITRFDATGYSTRIAAEVRDFDPTQFMERKDARRAARFIQFAIGATHLALQDAQLAITDANREQVGVLIGSGIFERVQKVIVEQLGVDENAVTPEASFTDDFNADSLDLVELVMAFEQEFDVSISEEEAERVRTVADAVRLLSEKVQAEE